MEELFLSDISSPENIHESPLMKPEGYSFLYTRRKRRYVGRPRDVNTIFKTTLGGCCLDYLQNKGKEVPFEELYHHVSLNFTSLRNICGRTYKGPVNKCISGIVNSSRIIIRTKSGFALGDENTVQTFTDRVMRSITRNMETPKYTDLIKDSNLGGYRKAYKLSERLIQELKDECDLTALVKKPFKVWIIQHFKSGNIEDLCELVGPQRFIGLVSGFAFFKKLLAKSGRRFLMDRESQSSYLKRLDSINDRCKQLDKVSEQVKASSMQ